MKRISVLLPLLLTTSVGLAQKAFIFNTLQKNGFISVSAGISQPLGTFARKTGDASSGMALRGQTMGAAAGYRLAGPLGLMARYEQTRYGIDPAALLNEYTQLPGDHLVVSVPGGRRGQWQTRSIMAGPYLTLPIGRVAFDVRAMAGQMWATCPETCIEGQLNRLPTLIRTSNQEARAIAAGFGLTTRYRITPTVALNLDADYNSASFTFANVPRDPQMGGRRTQTTFTEQQSLNTINLASGLTIQFRARNYVF